MNIDKVKFKTYNLAENNIFHDWPDHLSIWARADEGGEYEIHVRLKNGLGLISEDKFSLHEAAILVFRYADELNLSNGEIKIDLPANVLEKNGILNRHLMKRLKQKGLYYKSKS